MAITDELHGLNAKIRPYLAPEAVLALRSELNAIADRIDAEHESACAEAYGNGVMSVPIALDESVWVKLPVDADGVPIHGGDKMKSDYYEDGTVTGIQWCFAQNGELRSMIAVRPHGWDTPTWRDPESYRHYHAPTVEDVLREFADIVRKERVELATISEDTIAEYAEKLQLRGDGA